MMWKVLQEKRLPPRTLKEREFSAKGRENY